jgi:ribosomal protection tetracycline resistance protein
VQREVIAATLASDFGIEVTFTEATAACIERPRRVGAAIALLRDAASPYSATVGLRVAPLPPGSGRRFELDFEGRLVPIYIYKTHEEFLASMRGHVDAALEEGLHGWRVTDCLVTMTDCDYYVGDGRVPPGTTRTSAADFRRLTPLVLRDALSRAGTVVCEPFVLATAEAPIECMSGVLGLAARLEGIVESATTHGELATVVVRLSAARAQALHRRFPGVTGGEGSISSTFADYQPVHGDPPRRPAIDS